MQRSILLLLLVALTGAAEAQESFSYNWVQGSYSKTDYDSLGVDGDGLGLSVSVALNENFHVFGGYTGADIDSDVDTDGWNAGIGMNTSISELMDVIVQLSYRTTELDLPGIGSVENDGLGLGAGIRVGANDWIEIDAGLTYIDLDSGNETVFDAGFLYRVSDAFAVGISGTWDDDVEVWSIDARLYFD